MLGKAVAGFLMLAMVVQVIKPSAFRASQAQRFLENRRHRFRHMVRDAADSSLRTASTCAGNPPFKR